MPSVMSPSAPRKCIGLPRGAKPSEDTAAENSERTRLALDAMKDLFHDLSREKQALAALRDGRAPARGLRAAPPHTLFSWPPSGDSRSRCAACRRIWRRCAATWRP